MYTQQYSIQQFHTYRTSIFQQFFQQTRNILISDDLIDLDSDELMPAVFHEMYKIIHLQRVQKDQHK